VALLQAEVHLLECTGGAAATMEAVVGVVKATAVKVLVVGSRLHFQTATSAGSTGRST